MSQKAEEIELQKEASKLTTKTPQEKLAEYLAARKFKIARTPEELYQHSIVDDDGEEIDEFLRTREEWRKENRERRIESD